MTPPSPTPPDATPTFPATALVSAGQVAQATFVAPATDAHQAEMDRLAAIEAFGRSLEDVPISVADLAASRRHAAEAESV